MHERMVKCMFFIYGNASHTIVNTVTILP